MEKRLVLASGSWFTGPQMQPDRLSCCNSLPFRYRLIESEPDDGYHWAVYCKQCEWLDETQWWPNNRDRYHEMLLRNLQPPAFADVDSTSILRLIAEYVAENRP